MSITIGWGNDERNIIHLTLESAWTWDEYDTAASTIDFLLSDVRPPVDLVIAFRSCDVSGNAIKHIEEGKLFFWHSSIRYTALVGVKGFLRTLLIRFVQTYPERAQQLLFTGTIEAAHILLAERRKQSLASLQASRQFSTRLTLLN